MKLSTKTTIILFTLLVSIFPILIVAGTAKNKIETANMDNAVQNLHNKYLAVNQHMYDYLNDVDKFTVEVARSDFASILADGIASETTIQQYIEKLNFYVNFRSKIDNSVENIIIYDEELNVNTSTAPILDNSITELFEQVKKDSTTNISPLFMYESFSNGYVSGFLSFASILDSDKIKGYAVTVYNTNKIQEIMSVDAFGSNVQSMLVDSDKNIFLFPYTIVENVNVSTKYHNIQSKIDNTSDNKPEMFKCGSSDMLVNAKKMKFFNFTIVTMVDEETIIGKIEGTINNINLISVILIVIIAIGAIIFCILYFKPLEYLVASSKDKASGKNFTRIKMNANNELTYIMQACNKMADEINDVEERYHAIVEMNDNIVFEYDIIRDDVVFSKNFKNKFSFRPKSFKFYDSFLNKGEIHPEDGPVFEKFINTAFLDKKTAQSEFRYKTLFGDYVWFIVRCTLLFDKDNMPVKIIGIMVDIDSAKKYERTLIKRAEFDGLTGLLNRETFEKRLKAEYRLFQKRKTPAAVLFVDIDDFKRYNDDYSHACGDEVLEFIANTISQTLGEKGFSGRYGGDEFVLCCNDIDDKEKVEHFARKLITQLAEGFDCMSAECHLNVNCSIGISYFAEDRNNSTSIIDEADEAMYSVKKHGKSNFKEYFSK